jgi:hypothetical protein
MRCAKPFATSRKAANSSAVKGAFNTAMVLIWHLIVQSSGAPEMRKALN